MAFDAHKNFGITTVVTAPSPAASGTTLIVSDGTVFPGTFPYNLTIWPTGTQPISTNAEIVQVTARSTNTLTIVRAQEASSARTILAGDQVALTITTKIITDIEARLSSMDADGVTFRGTINAAGTISSIAFGNHTFTAGGTGNQTLAVRNTTAGTGNVARLLVGNDNDNGLTVLESFSSTYTSADPSFASGSMLLANGTGGLSIYNAAAGDMRFYTNGTRQMTITGSNTGVMIGTTSAPGLHGLNVGGVLAAGYDGFVSGHTQIEQTGITLLDPGGIVNGSFKQATGLVLGPLSTVAVQLAGFYMATWGTTASAANANVANSSFVKLVTSLRANKFDEQPIKLETAKATIMGLTPVLYRSRVDDDKRQWAGFIADDVEKVNPDLAIYDNDGKLQSMTYDRVPAYLVPVAQDHEARLARLESIFRSRK